MLYLLDSQYTYMHIFALTLIYQYDIQYPILQIYQTIPAGFAEFLRYGKDVLGEHIHLW